MKRLGNWVVLSVVIIALTGSCFDPPQYSAIPSIEYSDIFFKDSKDASAVDSLIISVKFRDGDGDLGLSSTDLGCSNTVCYADKFYFTIPALPTKITTRSTPYNYITYNTRRTNPNYDTLPAFIKPYNCINWSIESISDAANSKIDTFYVQLNPNQYNFFVKFFVQDQVSGEFVEFDWAKEFNYPNCGIPFNGRFPILSKDLTQKTALDGAIRYAMNSIGFTILFSIKVLKLQITIQDRALNKSNTVETPPFTLQQIKR